MSRSAFGVEDVRLSKAAELDSPASALVEAHEHGWHADRPHPHCDRCMSVTGRHRNAVRFAAKLGKSAATETIKDLSAAHAAGEHSAKAIAACPKCGPGSMRGRMSPRAWESRTASHTRKEG